MISAFNLSKGMLARTTTLAYSHADAPTAITVDASEVAVGAALEQLVNGLWKPLASSAGKSDPLMKIQCI